MLLLASLSVAAACGGSGGGSGAPPPGTGGLALTNFHPAGSVLGQASFTANDINRGGPVGADTMFAPSGRAAQGSFYAPDSANNRVLGFGNDPAVSGEAASFVLGQPSFTSTASSTTASGMNLPTDCWVSAPRLVVADPHNHRVLIWNSLPATTGAPADIAVGQTNLTSATPAVTASGLWFPLSACIAGPQLFVADSANHRVLIWDTVPTTHGETADVVLGQNDFTSGSAAPLPQGMSDPSSVWCDGVRLVVADFGNHRVLIWNSIPFTYNQPASIVLGQPDLSSNAPGSGARGLNGPESVCSNGTQLVVADQNNNRVLIWTPFPTTSHAPASIVLGQGDFAHTAANDQNQDGLPDASPTAQTLDSPQGVAIMGTRLVVSDTGNNRILIYE